MQDKSLRRQSPGRPYLLVAEFAKRAVLGVIDKGDTFQIDTGGPETCNSQSFFAGLVLGKYGVGDLHNSDVVHRSSRCRWYTSVGGIRSRKVWGRLGFVLFAFVSSSLTSRGNTSVTVLSLERALTFIAQRVQLYSRCNFVVVATPRSRSLRLSTFAQTQFPTQSGGCRARQIDLTCCIVHHQVGYGGRI